MKTSDQVFRYIPDYSVKQQILNTGSERHCTGFLPSCNSTAIKIKAEIKKKLKKKRGGQHIRKMKAGLGKESKMSFFKKNFSNFLYFEKQLSNCINSR